MTTKIQLPKNAAEMFAVRGISVPGRVFGMPALNFRPATFSVDHPKLKPRMIAPSVQTNSLEGFLEDPSYPWVYAVAAEPTDDVAAQVAAYLVYRYIATVPNSRVLWHRMHSRYDLIANEVPCSLLVLSGIYPDMTPYRMERVRDLLEHFDSIPRIVVISGEDPLAMMMGRLRIKPSSLFFHSNALAQRKVEVV